MPETRPAPPPLIHRAPACPMCDEETYWQDDYFNCDNCEAYWPDGTGEKDGRWNDEGLPRCRSQYQPYLGDPRPQLAERTYRCYLTEHHAGDRHQDPSAWCSWTTKQETSRAEDEEEQETADA